MMERPWQADATKRAVLEERVRITAACRDCDGLPRVADAGRCLVDDDGNAVQAADGLLVTQNPEIAPIDISLVEGLVRAHS